MTALSLQQPLAGTWSRPDGADGPYPQRSRSMGLGLRAALPSIPVLDRLSLAGGSPARLVARVNALEPGLSDLDEQALGDRVSALRAQLRAHGVNAAGAVESFALIRELSRRLLGLRHHDVQLRAGWALLNGRIAEMHTGEGKTLSATLAAATAALAGVPVHVITVNDYLAARDAEKLMPLYQRLGLQVGVVREGDEREERRAAYTCPVVYCSNKQLIFDYLQDQLAMADSGATRMKLERLKGQRGVRDSLLLRGLSFGIVDEADSVLVDEARTPMILAREQRSDERTLLYTQALHFVGELQAQRDFTLEEHANRVRLTVAGRNRATRICGAAGGVWGGQRHREQLLNLALTALHGFRLNEHYIVKDDKVCIVDAYTGRVLGDRSWQGGLQQMIELKEGLDTSAERETIARISQQRFFLRYLRLAGMTGTACEVKGELRRVYGLQFEAIPTHRESRREYLGERVFTDATRKSGAVLRRIQQLQRDGRPVLVGTRSIRDSEYLSHVLTAAGIEHRVLNARQDAEEAAVIARAGEPSQVTIATNMAGRGTDIELAAGMSERGGLHVIACERHEAGRIDRQLFGRAARQGDPGSCERMIALDDELMRLYLPAWLRRLASVMSRGGELPGWRGRVLAAAAQRRAERERAAQRKAVLEADRRMDEMLAFAGEVR